MQGQRVFVTGGAGVIGMELVPRLVDAGASVIVSDLKPKPDGFGADIVYRQGDLNSLSAAELDDFGPNIIIHLAATFERSSESLGFWNENFHHNVMLSHHLMTLSQDCHTLKRIVFASSYLIYDQANYQFAHPQTLPVALKESDPVRPRNLVGMAKFSHESELEFLSSFENCQFSAVSARIFRGFGKGSRDVISRWVRDLISDKQIEAYRPEGMFDFIYAADSAEGLLRLAKNSEITGPVNLGSGKARSVSDVLSVLRDNFPTASILRTDSGIPFEASEANIGRLEEGLGWKPAYSIEDAIPEIIAHERLTMSVE